MAPTELHWLGVAESARLIRRREVSPLEILDDILAWIDRIDDVTHTWAHLDAEGARAQAKAAERALLSGDDRGPLHGITYSVKDVIAVKDMPMECNSQIAKDFVPLEDAGAIKRLREAGAICLGKVTSHEFSWGVVSPPAKNPWDGRSVVGGSSGGSGCSVASGQCAFSVGADCGCSVRMPAALNGTCGLRSTFGRTSTSGAVPLSMTLDTVGPLARCVEDLAVALSFMAGHDPTDPTSSDAPVPDFTARLGEDVAGMRIGVPSSFFFEHLEDGVKRAVESGVQTLANLGMEVREVELPRVKYAGGAFFTLVLAESAATLDEYTYNRAHEYGLDVRNFVELGNLLLAKDYCRAQQMRTLVRQDFEKAFQYEGIDVLIVPTVAATAKEIPDFPRASVSVEYPDGYSEDIVWAYCRYTIPISLSGCPSLIVPCGFSDDGLPTGMQIVARHFDESTAFQVGYAFQQVTDWHTRRPTRVLEAVSATA